MNVIFKKHPFLVSFVCLLEIFTSICIIASALLISYTIQAAAFPETPIVILYQLVLQPIVWNINSWLFLLSWLIGFSLLGILFKIFTKFLRIVTIAKLEYCFRNHITKFINSTSYGTNLANQNKWISWYTNDADLVSTKMFDPFFSIFSTVANLLFGLVAFALLHWILLIAALVLGAIGFFFPFAFKKYTGNRMERMSTINENWMAKMNALLKLYDMSYFWSKFSLLIKLMNDNNNDIKDQSYTIYSDMFKVYILGSVLIAGLSEIIMLIVTILLTALPPSLGVAVIIGGNGISLILFNNLNTFGQFISEFISSLKIGEKFKIKPTTNKTPITSFNKLAVGLDTFKYDNKTLSLSINFNLLLGSKLLVTGSSGSGKSTLLKVLTGELTDYLGKVVVNETDYNNFDFNSLQKWMWYIGPQTYLFKGASLQENITLFDEKVKPDLLDLAMMLAQLTSLKQRLNETVAIDQKNSYSQGQQQQIGLARFFYHQSQKAILLIDEGLSNIDHEKSFKIEQVLLTNRSFSLINVSHHVNQDILKLFDSHLNLDEVGK